MNECDVVALLQHIRELEQTVQELQKRYHHLANMTQACMAKIDEQAELISQLENVWNSTQQTS
jgi:hypothetical protein